MMTYEEKLKELLIDDKEILKELIEKAKPLFRINKNDGIIVFKIPLKELSDKQVIILYCLGAHFAVELNLREQPEVTNDELIKFTGKTKHTINPRLSELKREKKLSSPSRGLFKINPLIIEEDIEIILQSLRTKKITEEVRK